MAWIEVIDEKDATGKLEALYERIGGRTKDSVANILKVHSLHPDALEAHLNLYETMMFGESGLNRVQREMIAVVVSSTNECEYWTSHHGEALRFASEDNQLMNDIAIDFMKAKISKRDKLMLTYVRKLTLASKTVVKKDIDNLRKVDFTDRDIFDVNQITAYFNYVNRIADGLGVILE